MFVNIITFCKNEFVLTFGTICVDVIVITVAVTQFIKKVLENSGGIISFFEQ